MALKKITQTGKYDAMITDAMIDESDDKFKLILKCETEDEYFIYYNMYYSSTVISSGKNAGKTLWESNTETLKSLGIEEGLLKNIRPAINTGLPVNITVDYDYYTDKAGNEKEVLKCKWINPPLTTVNIDDSDFDSLMAKVGMKLKTAPTSTNKTPNPF